MFNFPSLTRGLRLVQPTHRWVAYYSLTWLGIVALLLFLLLESRHDVEVRAEADAATFAELLDVRLSGVLRPLQRDFEHLGFDLLRTREAGHFDEELASDIGLFSRRLPEVLGMHILSPGGDLVHSAGRGALAAQAAVRSPGISWGARASGVSVLNNWDERQGGRQLLPLVMPVMAAGGRVEAIIVAVLDLDYMMQTLSVIKTGGQGFVEIRQAGDGRAVFHWPLLAGFAAPAGVDDPVLERIRQGGARGGVRTEAADGLDRVVAYRRVDDFPLYVTVSLATVDFLAEWHQIAVMGVISLLLLFLVLSLLLLRVLRAEREERQNAALLEASESRYRMLAENSRDVIWTLDIPTRRYTYMSPSVSFLSGYRPEELVGRPVDAWLSAEAARRFTQQIDQCLRRMAAGDSSANVVFSELEQVRKDGSRVTTEAVGSYLLDADGVPRTILGITRNVSERKAAERALRETNRQLQGRIDEIGRLQVALQELAVRDGLTGLYNRRYLDETLEREVSRARREAIPLSLVMLDIDHFKRVNDTYGHQVGDDALRQLALVLLGDIRAEDVACRYGGEEFLILLPNMPLETALSRAEAWRQAVEALCLEFGGVSLHFTVSLGVAAYPDHGQAPDDLTRCADLALYQAKSSGRNRVVAYRD